MLGFLDKRGWSHDEKAQLLTFMEGVIHLTEDGSSREYEEWEEELERAREAGRMYVSIMERKGIEKGRTEGIQLGRTEGIQLGRTEGIQLGRTEGIQLGRGRDKRPDGDGAESASDGTGARQGCRGHQPHSRGGRSLASNRSSIASIRRSEAIQVFLWWVAYL